MLAAVIRAWPIPLTQLLHYMSGRPILRYRTTPATPGGHPREGIRHLTPGEQHRLDAPPGTLARWREGRIYADGPDDLTAAETTLTWLPDRFLPLTRELLEQGRRPAGHILGPIGMRREDRDAHAVPAGGVTSSALLILDGQPVALAAEHIPAEFCDLIAQAWERCLPGCG